MKLLHASGLALLAGLGFAACTHPSPSTPAPTSTPEAAASPTGSPEDPIATELKEHQRHHHHGGITQLIAMSLDTLGTDDAKRPKVEVIQDDLQKCMAPSREIERKLLLTLADGIAKGTIDTAKASSMVDKLGSEAGPIHACSGGALEKLHALLSPVERQALAEKVRAHWAVWRKVNHDAEPGSLEKGGRLADLAQELNLNTDQLDRMSAALRSALAPLSVQYDPKKGEEHMQAFTTAFVADGFVAKSVTPNENGHLAAHGAKRMVVFYETVNTLLTSSQRTMLADHLRTEAAVQPTLASK